MFDMHFYNGQKFLKMIPHLLILKCVFLYNEKYAKLHLLEEKKSFVENKSNTRNLTLGATQNCMYSLKAKSFPRGCLHGGQEKEWKSYDVALLL